jgi:hypothetical protein
MNHLIPDFLNSFKQPPINQSDSSSSRVKIHTWLDGDGEFCLFRQQNKLSLRVLKGTKQYELDLPSNSQNVADRVESLLIRRPLIEDNGRIHFSKPDDDLEIYHASRVMLGLNIHDIYMEYQQINRFALDRIRQTDISIDDQISYLKDFQIVSVRENTILLEKCAYSSRLDRDGKMVDRDLWAVSLINTKDNFQGHAAIIIEGMIEGNPLMLRAHIGALQKETLKPETVVADIRLETRNITETELERKRPNTWFVGRPFIQRMIERIGWEKEMKEKGKPQVYFNILGNDSVFAQYAKIAEFTSRKEFRESIYYTKHIRFREIEGEGSKISDNSTRIIQYENDGRVSVLAKPENCATWAANKLYLADIVLDAPALRWLFTRPADIIQA